MADGDDELYHPNYPYTRKEVMESMRAFLESVKQRGAIHPEPYAYAVICDERNNSQEDIDQGKLNVTTSFPRDSPVGRRMMDLVHRGLATVNEEGYITLLPKYFEEE